MVSKLSLFLLSILISIILLSSVEAFTTNSITGRAISQQASVNITVVAQTPTLTLLSPLNNTYLNETAILLNFTTTNAWKIWYKLDNTQNITLSSPTVISANNGAHILYIYANNTDGAVTSKNISFSVNTSRFTIINSRFVQEQETTNIDQLSLEELQNLSGFRLNIQDYGRIDFRQTVNLTYSNNRTHVDLDRFVNISNNKISIESSEIPGLNTSATLTLRGLSFTNPRILKDGELCSSNTCTEQSYSGGTLVFNVTSFSTYTSEETPESQGGSGGSGGPGGGGGGGGGGSAIGSSSSLGISEDQISVRLKQGETKTAEIIITNRGATPITLKLSTDKITRFMKIEDETIILAPRESKEIGFIFLARENEPTGITIGKIFLQTGSTEKEILVSVEVTSPNALMDVQVEIPFRFNIVEAGETLLAAVKLFNLGQTQKIDVLVEYEIRDDEDIVVHKEQETVAVETQASFVKSIALPRNMPPGKYSLYVAAIYEDKTASSSAWFTVGSANQALINKIMIGAMVLAILLMIIIIGYVAIRRSASKKPMMMRINSANDKKKSK